MRRLSVVLLAIVAAVALISSACGSDDDTSADTSTSSSGDSSTTETTDDGSDTTDGASTTDSTDPDDGSSTTDSSTDTTLPGEEWEGFFNSGQVVAVLGVAHDDVLNVRETPGASTPIVTTVGPMADDLIATGEARLLPSSIWYEVTAGGETGWANSRFLGLTGGTDDATAEFLDGGAIPETETMVEMGELVADGFASEDPKSLIVQSGPASVGDLGEIYYDVVGLGDDAALGYRLHIFAAPTESGEGFGLKSIERTTFCGRGLSGEFCV